MKIIKKWKRSLFKRMIKIHLITPKVIVMIDGGICSQMHQYLLGYFFSLHGFKVAYDISFYKEWGSDMNRKFVRNFDLLKAFPSLKLSIASESETSVYKQKFYHIGNNTAQRVYDFSFLNKQPPIYLGGYYHLPAAIWLPIFQSLFRINPNVLDKTNKAILIEISQHANPVAVHVRRGDLKIEIPAYGKPASLDYFQKSIDYIKQHTLSPVFYFFSDEPQWIEQTLIPNLNLTNNTKIINANGSDKGYMDLFLIAHCKHQITSKGTLGKYGALLNDNIDKIVILCDDKVEHPWGELLQNPIFI